MILFNESYIEVIGWTLIHSVWQISLVAIILWFCLNTFKKLSPVMRFNLTILSLLIIFFSSAATFVSYLQEIQFNQGNESSQILRTNHLNENILPLHEQVVERSDDTLYYLSSLLDQNMALIVLLWLAGFLFFSVRLTGSYVYIFRLRKKHCRKSGTKLSEQLEQLTRKLKIRKKVELLESQMIKIPVVLGYLKPVIILPLGLATSVPYNQLEAILVHELAHIKRNDYLINLLCMMLEPVFFFHPGYWWIKSQMDTEREHACDDVSISMTGTEKYLQKALIEIYTNNQKPINIAAALYKNNDQLLNRIKRMKTKNQFKQYKKSNIFSLALLFTGVLMILFSSAFAPRPDDLPKPQIIDLVIPQVSETKPVIPILTEAPDPVSTPDPVTTPDSTKKAKAETKNEGKVQIELDEKGNLISVTRNGKELKGEKKEKYEKLALKMKMMNDKEKVLEENRERLQDLEKQLQEMEKQIQEFHSKYDEARQEYHKLSREMGMNEFPFHWQEKENNSWEDSDFDRIPDHTRDIAWLHNGEIYRDLYKDMNFDEFNKQLFEDQQKLQQQRMEELMAIKELKGQKRMEMFEEQFRAMEELKELKETDRKTRKFESKVRYELVKDGIIASEDELLNFELSKKKMVVNGKKQSSVLRDKYLELYDKLAEKPLESNTTIKIAD